MKKLLTIIKSLILSMVIIILHFGVINNLPYPFNYTNIIFIALVWFLIFNEITLFLAIIVPLAFLMELFSAAPFGVYSLATIMGLGLIRWLLINIFTNRAAYIIFLAGWLGLAGYHLAFLILNWLFRLTRGSAPALTIFFFVNILWSVTISAAALTIIFLITAAYRRRFNPRYANF